MLQFPGCGGAPHAFFVQAGFPSPARLTGLRSLTAFSLPLKHQQPLARLAAGTPRKCRAACVSPWECPECMASLSPRPCLPSTAVLHRRPLERQTRLRRAAWQASRPPRTDWVGSWPPGRSPQGRSCCVRGLLGRHQRGARGGSDPCGGERGGQRPSRVRVLAGFWPAHGESCRPCHTPVAQVPCLAGRRPSYRLAASGRGLESSTNRWASVQGCVQANPGATRSSRSSNRDDRDDREGGEGSLGATPLRWRLPFDQIPGVSVHVELREAPP